MIKILYKTPIIYFFGCAILTLVTSFKNSPQKNASISANDKLKVIVIDAGHGGKDPGAVGKLSREKDIALQVALKLGKKIEANLAGVKVVYTRKSDTFPKLYERPALANKNKADLFISIHLNAGGSASGTETFVLGYNSMVNQDAAIRENASILLEDNHEDNYGGFDPKDPSSYIVFKLMKRQYRDRSIKLAKYIQAEYSSQGRVNRGIKELPLAVLKTAAMPAVLTEIGFISNSREEKYMLSAHGQAEIVNNLFNAIKKYKTSTEK